MKIKMLTMPLTEAGGRPRAALGASVPVPAFGGPACPLSPGDSPPEVPAAEKARGLTREARHTEPQNRRLAHTLPPPRPRENIWPTSLNLTKSCSGSMCFYMLKWDVVISSILMVTVVLFEASLGPPHSRCRSSPRAVYCHSIKASHSGDTLWSGRSHHARPPLLLVG